MSFSGLLVVALVALVAPLAVNLVRPREMLGNFPQAFSHIGLINAAPASSQARGSS